MHFILLLTSDLVLPTTFTTHYNNTRVVYNVHHTLQVLCTTFTIRYWCCVQHTSRVGQVSLAHHSPLTTTLRLRPLQSPSIIVSVTIIHWLAYSASPSPLFPGGLTTVTICLTNHVTTTFAYQYFHMYFHSHSPLTRSHSPLIHSHSPLTRGSARPTKVHL